MKIPVEVRAAVAAAEERKKEARRVVKPQCWKELGEMRRFHEHDQNGRCLKRNWSKTAVTLRK